LPLSLWDSGLLAELVRRCGNSEQFPDWQPGKGCTLPISRLPELKNAIDKAIRQTSKEDAEGEPPKGKRGK